jgi:DMSO/TMAO reductase YedYZ molybdopterin-dependent catalytic subunit
MGGRAPGSASVTCCWWRYTRRRSWTSSAAASAMSSGRLYTRRSFLVAAALPLGACDGARPQAGFLGRMERFNEGFQRLMFNPRRLAPELAESAQSSERDFPPYFISRDVPLAPPGWTLQIGGLVARPGRFTVDDLQRMTRTNVRVRHHCVEGWSAVAAWNGVKMSDVAQAVGADPHARYVEFRSFDQDYYSCWDRESALHPQTLLAYGMNGQPLAPGHGAPLRLYASVKLGYKMVKYLTTVVFQAHRTGGYWEDQGYEWFAGV